eukprot:jgi/Bigna1/143942/aug1.82_g18650
MEKAAFTDKERNASTEATSVNPDSFSFIELFSGIGGFRVGLEALGGTCVWACEIEPQARKCYRANFPCKDGNTTVETEKLCRDITKVDVKMIPEHDILTAGFPCQPFSRLGTQPGLQDERKGGLFGEIVRIAEATRPKALLLENVPGLLVMSGQRDIYAHISRSLERIGYEVYSHVMDSATVLPQRRRRLYIVGETRPRFLAPREFARLQGFPESFRLDGQTERQNPYAALFGNAVSPPIVTAIGGAILHWLSRRGRRCRDGKDEGRSGPRSKSSRLINWEPKIDTKSDASSWQRHVIAICTRNASGGRETENEPPLCSQAIFTLCKVLELALDALPEDLRKTYALKAANDVLATSKRADSEECKALNSGTRDMLFRLNGMERADGHEGTRHSGSDAAGSLVMTDGFPMVKMEGMVCKECPRAFVDAKRPSKLCAATYGNE